MITKARLDLQAYVVTALACAACSSGAYADGPSRQWAIHGQTTFVLQGNGAFHSPYEGPNSLDPHGQARETFDATLYGGFRAWPGIEIWINAEMDQGFGLSNTLGLAGFPSGEAYKVGKRYPYAKLPRWFLRQTFDLGGEKETIEGGLNQLPGTQSGDRLVLTFGKFAVVDIFDTNKEAHDSRSDFLNWTIIDAGTFDYAANAWGYTYGAAGELYSGRWSFRAGIFALSDVPNSEKLDASFGENELVAEVEHRHAIGGEPGNLKITVFRNHGRMGSFGAAVRMAEATDATPDISRARKTRSRAGASFSLEQQLSKTVSFFARGGIANGKIEPFEFTDLDRSISSGFTIKGNGWGRADDRIGIAAVVNSISAVHQRFLALGGLGILVGDGRLPHPASEQILETYYDFAPLKEVHLSFDGQLINHPAFNRDRGPVAVGAIRLHGEF